MSAVPENLFGSAANDSDAQETREWIDALAAVIANSSTHDEGRARAHFLLEQLLEQARQEGVDLPFSATTGRPIAWASIMGRLKPCVLPPVATTTSASM